MDFKYDSTSRAWERGCALPTFPPLAYTRSHATDHDGHGAVRRTDLSGVVGDPAPGGRTGDFATSDAPGEAGGADQLDSRNCGRGGVAVLDPEDANEPAFQALLAAEEADLLVVCDYGQILAPATLATARRGGINLHASLLPKYRGAAPINWAIYHGESETGVSVIHMTAGVDAGPCLAQSPLAIGPEETAGELEPRLAEPEPPAWCARRSRGWRLATPACGHSRRTRPWQAKRRG